MGRFRTVELVVRNMTCGHCVNAVKKALSAVPGVSAAEVTLDPPRATVAFDPDVATVDALSEATAAEGYPSFSRPS